MIRSSFIFKENYVFIEEELYGIGNLVDLPRLMFIYEECLDLKVVVDDGEVTTNNNRKKKSEVLQVHRCPLRDKCYRSGWGNHDFLCGLVVNKLKGRKLFPYSMNRNDLEITLAWRDGNYCTMENLRYLLCSKWNILKSHVE